MSPWTHRRVIIRIVRPTENSETHLNLPIWVLCCIRGAKHAFLGFKQYTPFGRCLKKPIKNEGILLNFQGKSRLETPIFTIFPRPLSHNGSIGRLYIYLHESLIVMVNVGITYTIAWIRWAIFTLDSRYILYYTLPETHRVFFFPWT